MTEDQDMDDMPTNPGFKHGITHQILPLDPADFGPGHGRFPRGPGYKSLEQLAMETGDLNAPILHVNVYSRLPVWFQLWIIRVKLFIQSLLT